MRLTAEIRYQAGLDAVFAMISDRTFHERKCIANGATGYEVDLRQTPGGVLVTTRRTLPTSGVPDLFRSLVGDTLVVTQVDDWTAAEGSGGRDGRAVVEVQGAPVRFTAALRLLPDGPGAVQTVAGDLKASVPLLGSRIEKAVEPAIRAAIRAEERTATAWLNGG